MSQDVVDLVHSDELFEIEQSAQDTRSSATSWSDLLPG